jgi:subtilisin family serine protease
MMKSFYTFSTSDYTPVSFKNRYLSEYYDQAKSLLKTQFQDKAILGLLAKENRIGKTVQWQSSFSGEFKRISEFDESTQAYLSDKFCLLRDQILNYFGEKSKQQKGANANEWKEIFEQIFNPTNLIIFSNGEDISIVWGWALMNNENYLPFLNYTKKLESVPTSNPIEPLEPINEGDETDSGVDEPPRVDKGNDIIITGIEEDPVDENEEPIEIVLDGEEQKEEEIDEEDEPSEEIEETPVKPIDDEPEKPASNWFFAFLNWLEWFFKKFWWVLLILLLILLLLLFKKCGSFGAASGNETSETRKREELNKILPKEPRKRPVIDTTKIIRGEDSTKIIGNIVNIALKDKTKKFEDFVLDLKKAYPSKEYKVVYYDNETNRLQFQFPDSLQASIKNDLRTKLKKYPLLIWDEQLFRSSKSFNDPVMSNNMQSWHLAAVGAPKAWDITTGKKEIIVAVIDDGFDLNHKDLQTNIVKPYNVITKSNRVFGRANTQEHGTHVSGLAIGKADNNFGIVGIAPGCSFMPVQISDGGEYMSFTDVIDGVLYAIKNGADVINMSLGAPVPPFFKGRPDSFMENWARTKNKDVEAFWTEVFTYATKENVTIVLAAGNGTEGEGYPVAIGYDPLNRSNEVINVSAIDNKGAMASFSNYGKLSHISAPGVNVYSSVPGNNFKAMPGTSMAAPIVSGAVALMKSIKPDIKNDQIKAILRKTGKPSTAGSRIGPIIQINKALEEVKKLK